MKEHDAEARLARAMEDAAPNRLDELLEVREEARRQEKIVDISAPPRKKRRRWQNFAAAAAAAPGRVTGGGPLFARRPGHCPRPPRGPRDQPQATLDGGRDGKGSRV